MDMKSCNTRPKRANPDWRSVAQALCVHAGGVERRFLAGDVIWQHERPAVMHFITAGVVKVVLPETHEDETSDLVLPGEIAHLPVLEHTLAYGSGIALTPGRAIVIESARLREATRSHPELGWSLLRITTQQNAELRMRVAALTAGSVPARLARLLCWLSWRMGIRDARGVFIPLRLTRRQLAAMVGCRVETSIRILGQWVRANMIELKREGIVLRDLELILAQGRAEPSAAPAEGGAEHRLTFASPNTLALGGPRCASTA